MRIGKEDYNSGSSDEDREQPEAGEMYPAVIGVIDAVGLHKSKEGKEAQKLAIGFELSWRDSKGRREVLFLKYTLSLWRKDDGTKASNLRALFDTLQPDADNSEADTEDFVGKPCRVLVGLDAKGRARVDKVLPLGKAEAIRPERDYSQPFGLWKWLIENRIDR